MAGRRVLRTKGHLSAVFVLLLASFRGVRFLRYRWIVLCSVVLLHHRGV